MELSDIDLNQLVLFQQLIVERRVSKVAENLGLITPAVEAMRERFGFPGMAILEFAFGNDGSANAFQPHNFVRNLVVYTGTHDNDTIVGWWNAGGTVPGH